MSQKNVDVVRRFIPPGQSEDLVPWMREFVERLGPDFQREAVLAYWAQDPTLKHLHPDFEWDAPLGGLSAVARGPREWALWMADWLEIWESYVHRVVEYRDLGDWVLVPLDLRARGLTGVPVEMRTFQIIQVRDGKVVVYRSFRTERKALEAAGLAEPAVSEESTTPEPHEWVRQGLEALGRRDFDGFMSALAPDAVWDLNAWGIGTFNGLAAIRRFVEDWLGSYSEYLAEAEQILDLGNGVVFVAYREVARPMGSQGRLDRRQGQVTVLREGSIERMTMYADADEARAAAEHLAQERR